MQTGFFTNEQLLKTLTTGTLAGGGALLREQQDKLLSFMLTYATMLAPGSGTTIRRTRQANGRVDKMWVHGPITVSAARAFGQGTEAGAEGGGTGGAGVAANLAQFYDTAYARFGQVPYDCTKFVARTAWSTEFLRENIERGSIEQELRRALFERIMTDLEDLAINGDDTITEQSEIGYLRRMNNGWDVLSNGANRVDAAGRTISKAIWADAIKASPKWLRRTNTNIKWFLNPDVQVDWFDVLGGRLDGLGSAAMAGQMPNPLGIPYQIVPLIPSEQAITVTEATAARVNGARHGPFTFIDGTRDLLVLDINNNGAVTVDFGNGGGGIPAQVAGATFTLSTTEACRVINAQLVAAGGGYTAAYGGVAVPDTTHDRIRLISPTTGVASEVEVQVAAGANQAVTADLLGLGTNLGGDDFFNDIQTINGAAAGTNTVNQGTFMWLADPRVFSWVIVTADPGTSGDGIRTYAEYNKDRDRVELVVYGFNDALIEDPQSIVKVVNLRTLVRAV